MAQVPRRAFILSTLAAPLGALSYQAVAAATRNVELAIATDGDLLAFKPVALTCPAFAAVRLVFKHTGKYVRQEHNWVLTLPGAADAVAQAGLEAGEPAGFVPRGDPRVLAATSPCSKGESVSVDFVAPAPGDYPFLCTNPGHGAVMHGVLHVVPARHAAKKRSGT